MIVNAKTVSVPTRVEITTEDIIRQLREAWLSSIGLPPDAFLRDVSPSNVYWVTHFLGDIKQLREATLFEQNSENSFYQVTIYAREIDRKQAGGISKVTPYKSDEDLGDSNG